MLRTRPWVPYLYAAPVVALLLLVFGYPLVRVFDFSFRRIRGDSGPWIGLDNYRLVLDDPTFHQAVKHSALLLLAVPIMVVISVAVALLLYERMRAWRLYRSVLFIPFILAVPIVGIVASYMFQFNGVVNSALRSVGLSSLEQDWIGSSDWALWTVMFVIIWREVGFGIVLFLARMLSLDEGPLEAARIDGASWWQRVRYVVLPEIRGAVELYLVIASITMVAWVFAYIWTITKGGPGDATMVLELYIYNQGLRNSLPGMASAVAVMLLGVTVVAIAILFWVRSRNAEQEVPRLMALEAAPAASSTESPAAPARRRRRRRRVTPWAIARHVILVGICLLAIYPLLFVLLTALKTQSAYADDPLGLPWPITFDNFGEALRGGEFFTWFKNSVVLTLGSVALATVSAALAAFAIARMRWRGQNLLLSINVALMIVPPVVILIPLFVLFVDLSLVSTYRGVIMVYAGLTIPFSVYLLTMFFRTVPHEILESALADGASHFRILVQIVLPMSAPALVTLIVVNSLWVWNELLIALVFLPSDELKTLMVGITVFRSRYNLDIPITMAGMLLSSLPMIALYLVGQRYFIRGLVAGAVKG